MKRIKILCIYGTRPEAIKMAPIIEDLKNENWAEVISIRSSQHKELLEDVIEVFDISPDYDLDVMKENQNLSSLTSILVERIYQLTKKLKPDIILAQGDTTTTMASSMVAFYENILFGHVEAGLRTWDIYNPFPEEANRLIISKFANFHFTPTEEAKYNLLKEGINESKIYVSGNTVIDALDKITNKDFKIDLNFTKNKRLILVTIHRRENFKFLDEICKAFKKAAIDNPEVEFILPIHPNPNVRKVIKTNLDLLENFRIIKPLDYKSFIRLMKMSYFIITDSGGIQEEAPALGKPVLILRSKTERVEAIKMGVAKLIGINHEDILKNINYLLNKKDLYNSMSKKCFPFGDGSSSSFIIRILKEKFYPKS